MVAYISCFFAPPLRSFWIRYCKRYLHYPMVLVTSRFRVCSEYMDRIICLSTANVVFCKLTLKQNQYEHISHYCGTVVSFMLEVDKLKYLSVDLRVTSPAQTGHMTRVTFIGANLLELVTLCPELGYTTNYFKRETMVINNTKNIVKVLVSHESVCLLSRSSILWYIYTHVCIRYISIADFLASIIDIFCVVFLGNNRRYRPDSGACRIPPYKLKRLIS